MRAPSAKTFMLRPLKSAAVVLLLSPALSIVLLVASALLILTLPLQLLFVLISDRE